jgi:hypothetical protein
MFFCFQHVPLHRRCVTVQQMLIVLVQAALHNGQGMHTTAAGKDATPFDSHECPQACGNLFVL